MTTAYEAGKIPQILMRHRLRIAREAAGLEQADLAGLMGVSRNTVGNAESGKTDPRKIVLNAWALATGVPVSWLERGESPQPERPDGGGGMRTTVDQESLPPGSYFQPGMTGTVVPLHKPTVGNPIRERKTA